MKSKFKVQNDAKVIKDLIKENQMSFNKIPTELKTIILSYLNINDLIHCALVNKNFREIIFYNKLLFENFELNYNDNPSDPSNARFYFNVKFNNNKKIFNYYSNYSYEFYDITFEIDYVKKEFTFKEHSELALVHNYVTYNFDNNYFNIKVNEYIEFSNYCDQEKEKKYLMHSSPFKEKYKIDLKNLPIYVKYNLSEVEEILNFQCNKNEILIFMIKKFYEHYQKNLLESLIKD